MSKKQFQVAVLASLVASSLLSGCVSTQNSKNYAAEPSYLQKDGKKVQVDNAELINSKEQQVELARSELRFVPPFKIQRPNVQTAENVLARFSDESTLTLTADGLLLKDYLHQVLGEQLEVSYVLSEEVKLDANAVTLNLQQQISKRKLFSLTEKLLTERDYVVRLNDDIFYIHKKENMQSKQLAYGYGKREEDVPNTSMDILQIVPFDYGLQASLPLTIQVMLGVKTQADLQRGVMTVHGKRQEILRALDLVNLMDKPSMYQREIGAYKTTFIDTNSAVNKLSELLGEEGISLTMNGAGKGKSALSVVQIENQGLVILFATQMDLLERANFWLNQIDQPLKTTELQYFMYQPEYSRAADLGVSLEALIGDATSVARSTSIDAENKSNQGAFSQVARSASTEGLKMVVDERSNTIIFYTSGTRYQQLIPLIKKLDVLPKQVMLEVVIAEVTLTDEFKKGVEFALQDGNYKLGTTSAFMKNGFGGLSYFVEGVSGNIKANFLKSNSLVNILSRPSLVVRDGVSASISVGTDIPVIGATSEDPLGNNRQTTQIEYRKTGVELDVTPTVNAQGVVLMEINQKISNETDAGSTTQVNPSVFERSIKTEVVAESGQTIILGGLISENRSNKQTQVPLLGDLPIVGHLFRGDTDSSDKTELVVLVTPRVIHNQNEWDGLKQDFQKSLENLTISGYERH
ncbi:Type 3 secretion system secretin [Pseudoalteromonas holothuriae]|uniref:Type 3 secretion system secretin n=1 Tax=Pseudoalteromonas holothuriae TaxID=2963714 RepID=A0ABM9GEG2_9GAMM|nr:secretin N-terminal domain-containing protein [Pseudoalteromonas sp. CIP111951]CAH9052741.1 Type 3 secretion system secretin [Pseudoalteromonas sp. CIP111951]